MTGYRDDREALRSQLDAAERRAKDAEAELQRIAAGQPTIAGLAGDSLFTLAKVALWLQFAGWVVLVLISVPAYISIAHDDPPFGRSPSPTIQGLLMAALVDTFFSPVGLTAAVAAWGLGKGRRWAWGAGLAAAALGLCGCWPVSIVVFAALLRDRVRHAFHPPPAPMPFPHPPR